LISLPTSYPLLLITACLLLAAAISWFLYRKNPIDIESKGLNNALMILRFVFVFCILFLILGPIVKTSVKKTEKPIVVIAIDNSSSLISTKDSLKVKNEFPGMISSLEKDLSFDYDVKLYSFGKSIKINNKFYFDEKQSNPSLVFTEIENKFSNLNLGAVIIATDGIYNSGINPLYNAQNLKAPIFTIALGDTNQYRDILISNVRYNQIAFAGNEFEAACEIKAFDCVGQKSILTVENDGVKVFEKSSFITNQNHFESVGVKLKASQEGTHRFTFRLSKITNEINVVNNKFDIYVNVIKSKQKILLLANAPHPDLSAIKQSIENNGNYEINLRFLTNVNSENLQSYDLLIAHQLPGYKIEGNDIVKKVKDLQIPILYVLGAQSEINQNSVIDEILKVNASREAFNDVQAIVNKDFSLFSFDENELKQLQKFPPLTAPFGTYKTPANAQVLLYQQIGNISTQIPLLYFVDDGKTTNGIICAEGFWRWRLYDYGKNQSQNISDGLMQKIVQLLCAKKDKSLFRVNVSRKRFEENDKVDFGAEVYNESFEPTNNNDVFLSIKNPQGKLYSFTFSKFEKSYKLDAGVFPPGNYSYEANTIISGRKETRKGTFAVEPLQLEWIDLKANHQLLNSVSQLNQGKMIGMNEIDKLPDLIRKNEKVKPVVYYSDESVELLDLKFLFFLIILFATSEWFIRKLNGSV